MNGKVVDCTGFNAVYCDIHGDCSCELTDDFRVDAFRVDAQCPIHGDFTDHPVTVSDHPIRRPDARGTDLLQLR